MSAKFPRRGGGGGEGQDLLFELEVYLCKIFIEQLCLVSRSLVK